MISTPRSIATMITIIILLSILPSAQNNNIVFEEIGEMTSAISYLHIIIPADIQGLKERAKCLH
jgi:hypothetical protein